MTPKSICNKIIYTYEHASVSHMQIKHTRSPHSTLQIRFDGFSSSVPVCLSVFLHASTACVPLIILIHSFLCSLLIPLHIFNSVKHKYRGSHPTAHKKLVLIDQLPRERNTDMSFHSITVGGFEKATCMMNIAGVKLIALLTQSPALLICSSIHVCVFEFLQAF